ncbi:MAG: integrase [Bacteroidetes bacterium]|nr:MAG: integrase [Bacteroidota bacterium]
MNNNNKGGIVMQKHIQRFIEDMELHGFCQRTVDGYTRSVRQLEKHYNKPADKITEEEIRQYFLYNKDVRKWAAATCTIALCGIKFFYEKSLLKEWNIFKLARPKREHKLPSILSKKEVKTIFDNVKMDYHRVCLIGIYSLGLRLQEGTHLENADIDSDRMFVHIRNGKGNKDRFVPLPKRTLEIFREHWRTHRNSKLLFPAPGRGQIHMPTAEKSLPYPSIQTAFHKALQKTKILKHASVHNLRHSYAVHLLEAGVSMRYVQEYLGHSDPRTTMVYLKLINISLQEPIKLINKVMADL